MKIAQEEEEEVEDDGDDLALLDGLKRHNALWHFWNNSRWWTLLIVGAMTLEVC